jgi:transposase
VLENVVVAKHFRSPQRDQVFLLPPDMGEWLPADHLVWTLIEVVSVLDLSPFTRRAKLGGAGRAPFDPAMLLTLLVYAYAGGERSSRQIERLCHSDVAFRVVCGNEPPDHTVIARFRAAHDEAFKVFFDQVLMVCAKAGLGRVATIAVDGTKIAANASKSANRSEKWLRAEVDRIVDEAAATDAAEDDLFGADINGDDMPADLANPTSRPGRVQEAFAQLQAEQAAETAANREDARVDHWEDRVTASQQGYDRAYERARQVWQRRSETEQRTGRRTTGPALVPPEHNSAVVKRAGALATVRARRDAALVKAGRPLERKRSEIANVTDPDSRLMRTRNGPIQGYNVQLAVADDQIIVGVAVTKDVVDTGCLIPMMTDVGQRVSWLRKVSGRPRMRIGTVLADAGYFSDANLTAPGPARLIAPITPKTKTTMTDSACDRMRVLMATSRAKRRYRRRGVIVEPVNGHLKDRVGLRQFSRRGLAAVTGETYLSTATLNLVKYHRAALA